MKTELMCLYEGRVVRMGDDLQQCAGIERIKADKWPQTWICTRTIARLDEVLTRMAQREWR